MLMSSTNENVRVGRKFQLMETECLEYVEKILKMAREQSAYNRKTFGENLFNLVNSDSVALHAFGVVYEIVTSPRYACKGFTEIDSNIHTDRFNNNTGDKFDSTKDKTEDTEDTKDAKDTEDKIKVIENLDNLPDGDGTLRSMGMKSPDILNIYNTLKSVGMSIPEQNCATGRVIRCIDNIKRAYEQVGPEHFDRLFQIIYNSNIRYCEVSTRGPVIRALAEVYHRIGEVNDAVLLSAFNNVNVAGRAHINPGNTRKKLSLGTFSALASDIVNHYYRELAKA